jgi:hypothetical protein
MRSQAKGTMYLFVLYIFREVLGIYVVETIFKKIIIRFVGAGDYLVLCMFYACIYIYIYIYICVCVCVCNCGV